MTTQVSFTADENLKNLALEKAKQEGITLKTLFIYTMKGFVEGKISLGLHASEGESGVEELHYTDTSINSKAKKLSQLLK